MKSMSKLLTLVLALCLLLSVGAYASAEPASDEASGEASAEDGLPGVYTDGVTTLVIADDLTFTMDKTGQNLEGAEFVLTVAGTVDEAGNFTITGLFDGDINLIDMASEDQKAGDLASVEAVFAMGKADASGEPSGEAAPGTYTDGVNTLVIADDMTFTMEKTGQNMEGTDFVLTVTGTVDEAGNFAITGLFDGDINLIEVATEDQIAADLASVVAAYNG